MDWPTGIKIKIYTRSMNSKLYSLSQQFLEAPYPRERLTYTSAEGYLHELVQDPEADWVINIDEDAFVTDNQALIELLTFTIDQDLINVGMPDGGVVPVRVHHPAVTNPFFNILNTKKIRQLFLNQDSIIVEPHDPKLQEAVPTSLLRHAWTYDRFEPYYDFFFDLILNGGGNNHLYLDAAEHADGVTTELFNHRGAPFLLHTWYSRDLGRDLDQTKRILKIVDESSSKTSIPGPSSAEKSRLIYSAWFQSLKAIRPIANHLSLFFYRVGGRLARIRANRNIQP